MRRTLLQTGQVSAAEVPLSHGRIQALQKRWPQRRRTGAWISSQQVGQSSLTLFSGGVFSSICKFVRNFSLLGKSFFFFSAAPEGGGKMECQSTAPRMKAAACSFVFVMHTIAKIAGAMSDQAENGIGEGRSDGDPGCEEASMICLRVYRPRCFPGFA